MEKRTTTMDDTVRGRNFRFNKLDARTGSWLFAFLMGKVESDEGVSLKQIAGALHKLTRQEFDEVQTAVLKKTFYLEEKEKDGEVQSFPVAIMNVKGEFVNVELATEAPTVFDVTSQAILFNILPFFQGGE